MQEVRVLLEDPVKAGGPPVFKLQQDPTWARKGEPIVWHFYALDDRVKWAVVRFDDASCKYFRTRAAGAGRQHYRLTALEDGSSQILGNGRGHRNRGVEKDKYTIEAWKGANPPPHPQTPGADGEEDFLGAEDPFIIISDP